MADYKIHHVTDKQFELHKDGENVGFLNHHSTEEKFYLDYVYVEPKHRGKEIGVKLVEAGLEMAEEKNLKPIPICGYAGSVMRRKGVI
ncbi:MAG: GNAT family N-acetyltransferase [Weeksellaceae bacterium]|nr:GNAT family N-acetyltransferase [Weeksellaceae bacterium]